MNVNMLADNRNPFFSVITVVFNDLAGLRLTEASMRMQKERDFEWIVVDGGSIDGTVEYLRSLALPYLKWSSERDNGIYDGMNKGTARAVGRYVIYMNGGDTFSDATCLKEVRHFLEKANWPELLYGGGNLCFSDGSTKYRAPRKMESAIRHCLPGCHQATYYRRDFLDIPPYDLQYSVSSDYYLSARCFMRGARPCYLNRPICNFAVGGTTSKFERMNRSIFECWHIQQSVLKLKLYAKIYSAIRRFIAHRRYVLLQVIYAKRKT
jgi:putative colanic acid biosynthesis glycosyltransferase WcaE